MGHFNKVQFKRTNVYAFACGTAFMSLFGYTVMCSSQKMIATRYDSFMKTTMIFDAYAMIRSQLSIICY